ncbi:MAG: GNAT family N-acetyltransferase [Dehalococcoidales bacterium]|nr:MAG: GNAT family N-acetyltransferase [Dehalococcoidales bacterium]
MGLNQADPSTILLREFHPEDYDAVTALWDRAGLSYRPQGRDSRERIESQIKRDNTIFLVAEMNGTIIASILGTHDGRKGWINRLVVAPELRHRNIARKLVTEVEDRLSRARIEVTACLIEETNIESMRFFQKLDYERYEVAYFSKRRSPDT